MVSAPSDFKLNKHRVCRSRAEVTECRLNVLKINLLVEHKNWTFMPETIYTILLTAITPSYGYYYYTEKRIYVYDHSSFYNHLYFVTNMTIYNSSTSSCTNVTFTMVSLINELINFIDPYIFEGWG